MKSIALIFVLLFTTWACTPTTEDQGSDDSKKSERQNEGLGTDRLN